MISACLDDSQIAALAIGETGSATLVGHLADCAPCRELVSAALAARTDAGGEGARRITPHTMLGRHRIERPLGAGGMGVVYLARDLELDRDVAIKLLRGGDHARLARESQVLAKLKHANVVTVHEVGRHGDASYLVMEHVEVGTVRDWLAQAPRSPREICELYAQAARGLAAAHAAGIVHRDIKPENVLVGADGRARISDFGLAGDQDLAGRVAGTPRFMAPEVLAGAPADPRSDQFSLAASLWDSLYGAPPRAGDTPPAGLRVLARGLAVDPAARYPSLDAFAAALEVSRRRWLAPAIVGAVTVVLAIGLIVAARPANDACGDELAPTWSASRRAAIGEHLRGIGGGATWMRLVPALDRYAQRWTDQRALVCAEATDPIAAREAACLLRHRHAFESLAARLAVLAPNELAKVGDAASQLPALRDCTAAARLAERQPTPSEPATRALIDRLERQFADARTRHTLGERTQAVRELAGIADQAHALGYFPLEADALGVVGRSHSEAHDPAAIPILQRAASAAQAGGDDRQLDDAALDLVIAGVILQRPAVEMDAWRLAVTAATARLSWRGDPDALRGEYTRLTAFGRDDLVRGNLAAADRELARAIEIGGALYGSHSHWLGLPRLVRAEVLERRGDLDGAAVLVADGLAIDDIRWDALAGSLGAVDDEHGVEALIAAAAKLYEVGRDDLALEFARRVRAETGGKPGVFLTIMLADLEASIALGRGDIEGARRAADEERAALGPSAIAAHLAGWRVTHAEILRRTGDPHGAELEYRTALPSLGHDAGAIQVTQLGLAHSLVAQSKREEARTLVEALVATPFVVPRFAPEAWLLAAQLRWDAGDRAAAIEAGNRAAAAAANVPGLTTLATEIAAWRHAH